MHAFTVCVCARACVSVYICVHACICVCERDTDKQTEDNLSRLTLSCYHVGHGKELGSLGLVAGPSTC